MDYIVGLVLILKVNIDFLNWNFLFRKSPDFKNCVLNFTSTIDVCLDEGEKDSKKILQNVTEALLSFVCHDEGDRIACKIKLSV